MPRAGLVRWIPPGPAARTTKATLRAARDANPRKGWRQSPTRALPVCCNNAEGAPGMYRQPNQRSHRIFRRYAASLPTSLSCINSTNQRLLAEETCCGDATRRGILRARRQTGATGCSLGLLSTTILLGGCQGSSFRPWSLVPAHLHTPPSPEGQSGGGEKGETGTEPSLSHQTSNGGPRRGAESGSDLLGRLSSISAAHQSTNAPIPSRGKENSSGATTTRTLVISRGRTVPICGAAWQPTRRNVEDRLLVHQSRSMNHPARNRGPEKPHTEARGSQIPQGLAARATLQ